jgi:hypothetical protein
MVLTRILTSHNVNSFFGGEFRLHSEMRRAPPPFDARHLITVRAIFDVKGPFIYCDFGGLQ